MATNTAPLKGKLTSPQKGSRAVVQQGQGVDNASRGGPPIQDNRLGKQTVGGESTVNSQPAK